MRLYKDKYYLILAVAAAVIGFVVYDITKAPTVSFWDCGEFIATSYIMGVPHPPGNPVYILLGRIFSMLPLAASIAVRVNLLSVLSSAGSIFVAFWLILRLSMGRRDKLPAGNARIGLGIGAFSGALIMGLSATFWSNAVETEVYGLSMLLMLIITYVAILWAESSPKPGSDRYLLLISYLLWLSLGIHMTTFILAVPLVLYLGFVDYKKSGFRRWPIWLIMSVFILYAVPIQTQIMSLFGIDISALELESLYLLLGVALLASVVMAVVARIMALETYRVWSLAVMIIISAGAGYSSQAYIPIRASEKPAINENDPSNWPRFKSFLERKQYGQESMITRMFHRRGSWQNQFVTHPSFGLLRLLGQQFSSPDANLALYREENAPSARTFALSLSILYILFLGLGGAFESVKRSRMDGSFVVLTMLLGTVGLVFYLNFSDGAFNKAIAPLAEVRNRDYFYTPGFMYFAILIGVAISSFLEWLSGLSDRPGTASRTWGRSIFAVAVLAALLLAFETASANFARNDRRGNLIPWDYANNILQSCDQDAILFTNGDNDTFPLWYLQEVEKVRRDVRVVNLSLLNTAWYIHQIKGQMGVPISLSYDQIENLEPVRIQGYSGIWRVQDEMVKHIITNCQGNEWYPPVYFAMTVASENKLGLEDHLILQGMAYKVVESTGTERVDAEVGQRIFGNVAHFRGIANPRVRKDDNDMRLVSNYISAMFQVVEEYEKAGKSDSALFMAEKAVALKPSESAWQAYAFLARMYARSSMYSRLDSLIAGISPATGERILLAVAQEMIMNREFEKAASLLEQTLLHFPSSFAALNNLVVSYYQRGDTTLAAEAIRKFRQHNSGDSTLMRSLDEMTERLEAFPLPPSGAE